jgi:hypothetical protein
LLIKISDFSRQFNHNKANFLFVTKNPYLGAYLFVMKKNIFDPISFSVIDSMFMSKQIRRPRSNPNEIQKTLWIGGHINIMRLCFPEIL